MVNKLLLRITTYNTINYLTIVILSLIFANSPFTISSPLYRPIQKFNKWMHGFKTCQNGRVKIFFE